MYNFSKVKHKKDLHEFVHPIFRRGNFKAINSIKRKVNNKSAQKEQQEQTVSFEQYEKLQQQLKRQKSIKETIAQQNDRTQNSNKDLNEYYIKVKKILLMFSVLSSDQHNDLRDFLIEKLSEFQSFDKRVFETDDNIYLLNHVQQASKKVLFGSNNNIDGNCLKSLFNDFQQKIQQKNELETKKETEKDMQEVYQSFASIKKSQQGFKKTDKMKIQKMLLRKNLELRDTQNNKLSFEKPLTLKNQKSSEDQNKEISENFQNLLRSFNSFSDYPSLSLDNQQFCNANAKTNIDFNSEFSNQFYIQIFQNSIYKNLFN